MRFPPDRPHRFSRRTPEFGRSHRGLEELTASQLSPPTRPTIHPVRIARTHYPRFVPRVGLRFKEMRTLSALGLSKGWARKYLNLRMRIESSPPLHDPLVCQHPLKHGSPSSVQRSDPCGALMHGPLKHGPLKYGRPKHGAPHSSSNLWLVSSVSEY